MLTPPPLSLFSFQDISENPKLVTDGVSGNDLNQGDVGNCWFVAACATLAGVKPLWDKVVVNSKDQVRTQKHTHTACYPQLSAGLWYYLQAGLHAGRIMQHARYSHAQAGVNTN